MLSRKHVIKGKVSCYLSTEDIFSREMGHGRFHGKTCQGKRDMSREKSDVSCQGKRDMSREKGHVKGKSDVSCQGKRDMSRERVMLVVKGKE